MRHGQITWGEDRDGNGVLVLRWDDGDMHAEPHPGPIDAGTDSTAIAALFGDFFTVEHDGEYIHVFE